MSDILTRIETYKRAEIAAAKRARPLAAIDEAADVVHSGRGVKFHPNFIEACRIAQRRHQLVGLACGFKVQSDDDGVVVHVK